MQFAVTRNGQVISLLPTMLNRHGLISGATGTGKTVTVQRFTELCSQQGIPSFVIDVKGDLSGIGAPGAMNSKIQERVALSPELTWAPKANPVVFWDVLETAGHRLRTTVKEMGALVLGHLLELNDTQESVLEVAFAIADDKDIPLTELSDLKALLVHLQNNNALYKKTYGNLASGSLAAIQRAVVALANQGGDKFFGAPGIVLADLLARDTVSGAGTVNVLDATVLFHRPRLYGAVMLWFLNYLFRTLPEVGDQAVPRLVVVVDEAHLLFANVSRALTNRVEQTVRLIRSKGVGVFFVSQLPTDLPEVVLGQLGNRVQHALRSYTQKDSQAIRAAARGFRSNPGVEAEKLIPELGVGEALVSFLDSKGEPLPVTQALILPPQSRIGAMTASERQEVQLRSPLRGRYEERLKGKTAESVLATVEGEPEQTKSSRREGPVMAFIKSFVRTLASQLSRALWKGVFGAITKRR